MTAPMLDPDDQLASELDQARAEMEQVEAENEALRARLGARAEESAPRKLSSAGREREGAAAYRAEDRGIRIERELGEANEALATLRIENAILKSRAEPMKARGAAPIRKVAAALAVTLGGVFLWFLTRNPGMLLFAAILALGSWGATVLIDRIRPDGSNARKPPPMLPPGGV